ncbi:MAG: cupin-like domain-containing protein [Pseudomonadota bacterium]
MSERAQILVRHGVDLNTFREQIVTAGVPVVMKDLVADWPAVRAGRESPRALADLIRRFDRGRVAKVIEGPPSIRGRIFYREDLRGLNFIRTDGSISATVERLLAIAQNPDPPLIFLESMKSDDFLPQFAAAHRNPLLAEDIRPRIWIGNDVKVQTHYDLLSNIACVVGGRRRFTLFPPDQLPNLYMGPIEFTPSGTPISLVPLNSPDLTRFPRFAEALRHAQEAELTPGDALYIPYGWWHQVESLTPFNVLANYWWNSATSYGSPYGVLLHAALCLRDLPAEQRAVWRTMFEELVFKDPEQALAHLTPAQRGLLGPPTPKRVQEVRAILAESFSKPI